MLIFFSVILLFSQSISADSHEKITFIALGHVYPDYDALNLSVSLIEKENPDFVIFLGDTLVTPSSSWNEIKPIIDQITAPVYFVPGNHDIYENGSREGFFLNEMSGFLYTKLEIKNISLIILNTVTDKVGVYGVSDKQVSFVREIYEKDDKRKFIFMHNCLFYNQDNQFCNSREFFFNNKWNEEIVPIIQEETVAVFVGDTGVNEPYFGLVENEISYFGVGFSPSENRLKIPQHMLKVVLKGDQLTVTPIPIRQDLTKVVYSQRVDREFFPLFKVFIKKNLAFVLKILSIVILALLIATVYLGIRVRKR